MGANHPSTSNLDKEPNPFERSFSGIDKQHIPRPRVETAVANVSADAQTLPPVASISSPSATAMMNTSMNFTGGWSSFGSLRNGPLSPAMLLGPAGLGGFDGTLRTGLTPNESSIRTGLTPRGENYSLPSPNTSALLGLINNSGARTPGGSGFGLTASVGTDFRAPMFARPLPKEPSSSHGHMTQHHNGNHAMMHSLPDAADAANGLYLLAQHSQQHSHSEDLMRRAATNNAKHALDVSRPYPTSESDVSPISNRTPISSRKERRRSSPIDDDIEDKPSLLKRGRGVTNKSARASTSSGNDSDEESTDKGGRKETDEEKRKNFLERNRQAALKCRQRKKQWLQNLQAKVEFYGAENDSLTGQVTSLREEIVNLKTLLLAHKDCAVVRQQSGNQGTGNSNGGLEAMQIQQNRVGQQHY